MNIRLCECETDVLALVAIGQWPRQAEPRLVDHVAGCASCQEALVVAVALRDLDDDGGIPQVPDARAVWQRAQWVARREAMLRAARPVLAMQSIAALLAVAAIGVALVWLTSWSSLGEQFAAVMAAAGKTASSTGVAAVTVSDLFTVEVPAGLLWIVAGGLAVGLAAIGLAVGLSALADLRFERYQTYDRHPDPGPRQP